MRPPHAKSFTLLHANLAGDPRHCSQFNRGVGIFTTREVVKEAPAAAEVRDIAYNITEWRDD